MLFRDCDFMISGIHAMDLGKPQPASWVSHRTSELVTHAWHTRPPVFYILSTAAGSHGFTSIEFISCIWHWTYAEIKVRTRQLDGAVDPWNSVSTYAVRGGGLKCFDISVGRASKALYLLSATTRVSHCAIVRESLYYKVRF